MGVKRLETPTNPNPQEKRMEEQMSILFSGQKVVDSSDSDEDDKPIILACLRQRRRLERQIEESDSGDDLPDFLR
jgi:hypothetical protein